MTFKITINKEECIGCGACVNACNNFELEEGDEVKAKVKKAAVKEIGCNKEAEEVCPVDAIKITKV